MNCRQLERLLDQTTPLDAESRAHLESCAACRELEEMVRASLAVSQDAPPPGVDLTREVMARTGGPACETAAERLIGLADGDLRGIERDLVVSHLQGCAPCADLAGALGWMSLELPALAAIDPGEEFTAAVMRATLQAPAVAAIPLRVSMRMTLWWTRCWTSLWDRPRFPWEAAYAGAMVLWLLFGAGFAPFRDAPARALELARSDTVQPASLGRQVWQATGGRVPEELKDASASLARHGGEALGSAFRGDLSGSAVRLKDMGGDLKRIVDEMRRRGTQANLKSKEA